VAICGSIPGQSYHTLQTIELGTDQYVNVTPSCQGKDNTTQKAEFTRSGVYRCTATKMAAFNIFSK
jgi:hypothetical protein